MGCSSSAAVVEISAEHRERINAIINFWFPAGWDRNTKATPEAIKTWFVNKPEDDANVQRRFQADYDSAVAGRYKSWESDPQGLLALIIILDQFSRQLFRKQAKAFAADPQALKLSQKAVANEASWKNYALFERYFLIMPMMHAEDPAVTGACVQQFIKLD